MPKFVNTKNYVTIALLSYAIIIIFLAKVLWIINRFLPTIFQCILVYISINDPSGYHAALPIGILSIALFRDIVNFCSNTKTPPEYQYSPVRVTYRPPYELVVPLILLTMSGIPIACMLNPPNICYVVSAVDIILLVGSRHPSVGGNSSSFAQIIFVVIGGIFALMCFPFNK